MTMHVRFLPFLSGLLALAGSLSPAAAAEPAAGKSAEVAIKELAPLPAPVTSFGAASAGGAVYVFGGHLGSPHEYSAELQATRLLRLDLAESKAWETVAEGPRRTGLAMVAYEGRLYRIGGWEARNAGGEKWDLYSTPDFARFDPATKQSQDLAPLPRGRSSHDAAILGSRVYVVGGWELKGQGDGDWHDTALVCDLADPQPKWEAIAQPPFRRRALAVAAHGGKVYVLGGMSDSNEPTTAVDCYDPASNQWSAIAPLPGEGADGFGMTAIGTTSGLYASTRSGAVYQLAGDRWVEVAQLKHPRLFHRFVAVDARRLVVVGGTSRAGKVAQVELLELPGRE